MPCNNQVIRRWYLFAKLAVDLICALAITNRPCQLLVGWILSFGARMRVVSPAALRDAVRNEAEALFTAKSRFEICWGVVIWHQTPSTIGGFEKSAQRPDNYRTGCKPCC
jgi:hypothetical protein